MSKTHFELFVKKGAKTKWALAEAHDSRDRALKIARQLLEDDPDCSVKVFKQAMEASA